MIQKTRPSRQIVIATVTILAPLSVASFASGQALPGQTPKFEQLPLGDLQTNPASQFPGHDELSTATLTTSQTFTGTFAADDFSDNVSSPIVDVEWWGSYLNSTAGGSNQVQDFLISFESNVPATSASGFSQPGQSLSAQIVTVVPTVVPGGFTQTAVPSVPGPDGPLYQYDAELTNPFPEQAGQVYWLKIVALTDPNLPLQWGWHNRDYTIPDPYAAPPGDTLLGTNDIGQPVYHYVDDAVTGDVTFIPRLPPPQDLIETNMSPLLYSTNPSIDGFGATGVVPPSEDLAFELYYVPEPTSLPILAGAMFIMRRRRSPCAKRKYS